jgi:hypothetical protein
VGEAVRQRAACVPQWFEPKYLIDCWFGLLDRSSERTSLGWPVDRVETPPDQRSPVVIASQWASRVMTVSIEMVLPGLIGYWIDQKLDTVFLFMLIGFTVGITAAVWHLIQMTSRPEVSPEEKQLVADDVESNRELNQEGKPKP